MSIVSTKLELLILLETDFVKIKTWQRIFWRMSYFTHILRHIAFTGWLIMFDYPTHERIIKHLRRRVFLPRITLFIVHITLLHRVSSVVSSSLNCYWLSVYGLGMPIYGSNLSVYGKIRKRIQAFFVLWLSVLSHHL